MKRLTEQHCIERKGYYAKCSETCHQESADCIRCRKLGELADRLGAYEDTGLTPEEIERIVDAYGRGHTLRSEGAERLEIVREIPTERLRELAKRPRVTRCGKCRLCSEETTGDGRAILWCAMHDEETEEEDYCSYGERKNGEKE